MSEDSGTPVEIPRAPRPEFLTETRFDDFDLHPDIIAGLDDSGFRACTPIQAQSLPVSLTGKDIAGQAQTGTGKTAAFLVTVFAKLVASKSNAAGMPRCLIVAPTRELAMQVYDDAQMLGRHTKLSIALAIGGIDYQKQADDIKAGPDIIIATPGRIIDYLKQGIFKPQKIEVLVVDEADRLFDLGFIKDLRFLLRKLPHYEKRQTMLFSATLSYRVLELTYEFMNLPEFISVTPEEVTVDRIEQSLSHVGREDKFRLLLGMLNREEWSRVLIFVNTKAGVEWVAKKLKANGLPAEGITGDLPQRKRLKLMEQFKDDRLKILVATDVASRGIHVEDVTHVFNYDLPQDVENYVHRIGRTARAGKTGRAISLACEDYVFHLEPLEEMLGYQIPVVWPEDDWFGEDKAPNVRIDRRPPRTGRPPRGGPRPGTKPARGAANGREKPGPPRGWRRYPMSKRAGGIFGLSPRSWPGARVEIDEPEPELDDTPKVAVEEQPADDFKKKRRRRRRRKKPIKYPQTFSPLGGVLETIAKLAEKTEEQPLPVIQVCQSALPVKRFKTKLPVRVPGRPKAKPMRPVLIVRSRVPGNIRRK